MRKKISTLWMLWLATLGLWAANPVKKTVQVAGFEREYLIYTPQNVHAGPAGLIVGLHGFNGSMEDFFDEYQLCKTADSLNYVIIAPQALPEQEQSVIDKAALINSLTGNRLFLQSVWACGLKVKAVMKLFNITLLEDELNKHVDDVEFIGLLIHRTLEEYAMKSENIFLVGTSMGGYMAYQFALKQPVKPAGIISIVGSMGLNIQGMDQAMKVPLCDFHSLTDEVVPYAGSFESAGTVISLARPKEDVVNYWVQTNGAGAPTTEAVRYYPSINGIMVEKITFPHPEYEVIHYRMSGSDHSHFFRKESGDCMDYLEEITKFITSHALPQIDGVESVPTPTRRVYPNPARDILYFGTQTGKVVCCNLAGQAIWTASFQSGKLDISSLQPGMYILRVQSEGSLWTTKLIKQ